MVTLDMCLSIKSIPKAPVIKKYGKLISKLIDCETRGINHGIAQYIIDTFHLFVTNKRGNIWISITDLVKTVEDKKLLDNILISPTVTEWNNGDSGFIRRSASDKTNLFNPVLIKLFKNVKSITMQMSNIKDRQHVYTVSLMALLSIIHGSTVKHVRIMVSWSRWESAPSWLRVLWESHSKELIEEYQSKQYQIQNERLINEEAVNIYKKEVVSHVDGMTKYQF